ncbi:MAG: helix-turn-helix transcriptional regulator [Chlamydiia bacterium]|nr:helix-turn-helix transcriptional regulator [Chlamydiia bacterium]
MDLGKIGKLLREERLKKGWSQRALAERIGLPQSHLSKIENGAVDLQTSTLVELARTLELELMLIDRKWVPAVAALIRGAKPQTPLYQLEEEDE